MTVQAVDEQIDWACRKVWDVAAGEEKKNIEMIDAVMIASQSC